MAQEARFDFGILLLKIVASEKNKEERLWSQKYYPAT